MVTNKEKIAQIDQEIQRLQNDRVGATRQEIDLLNQRIALKQEEKASVVSNNWTAQLEQQEEALAQQHANDADYQQQRLQLQADFWTKCASQARAGSQQQVQAEQAAASAMAQVNQMELAQKLADLSKDHAQDSDYKHQALALEVEFWHSKAEIAKAGSTQRQAAESAEVEAKKRLYEADAQAAEKAEKQKAEAAKATTNADIQIQNIRLQGEKDELQAEVDAHEITAAQKIEKMQELTNAAHEAAMARLNDEINSLTEGTEAWVSATQQRRVLMEEQSAENSRLARELADAQKKAASESGKAWEEGLAPVSRAFDGMLSGVLMGTQSISQAVRKMGADIAASFAESIAKMLLQFAWFKIANALGWTQMAAAAAASQTAMSAAVFGKESAMTAAATAGAGARTAATVSSEAAKTAATTSGAAARTASGATENAGFFSRVAAQVASWLGLEVGKTADTVAGGLARDAAQGTEAIGAAAAAKAQAAAVIPAYAAEAAAAAMASVAAIPITGWAMAPEVGEATYGEAMSFLPMASAAGGWDRVPTDGALAELHKDEMVLPASTANPLRDLLASMSPAANKAAAPLQSTLAAGAPAAIRVAQSMPRASIPAMGMGAGGTNQSTNNSNTVHMHYSPQVTVANANDRGISMMNNTLQRHSDTILATVNDALRRGGTLGRSR